MLPVCSHIYGSIEKCIFPETADNTALRMEVHDTHENPRCVETRWRSKDMVINTHKKYDKLRFLNVVCNTQSITDLYGISLPVFLYYKTHTAFSPYCLLHNQTAIFHPPDFQPSFLRSVTFNIASCASIT